MNLIRLSAAQRRVKKYEHPAFEGVKRFTLEQLEPLVEAKLSGGDGEPLALALRSTARYLVGRYLWHFPGSRRFLDDMVGEALLAISMMVGNLEREMLEDSNIQKLASSRMRTRVEQMLNSLQSLSAPAVSTQRLLVDEGGEPIYLAIEREPLHEDKEAPDAEEAKSDMLDALEVLRDRCETAALILDPGNWGTNDTELSQKLECDRSHITYLRQELLTQFLKLTGDSE